MAPNVSNQQQARVWADGQYITAPVQKGVDGKLYVEHNGKKYEVDKNDMFGINSNLTEWPQHFIDYYDKQMANNEEKENSINKLLAKLLPDKKAEVNQYNSYLSSAGVDDYKEITDNNDLYKRAKQCHDGIVSYDKTERSYNTQLRHIWQNNFNNALDKQDWQNQLALAEHVQQSLGFGV